MAEPCTAATTPPHDTSGGSGQFGSTSGAFGFGIPGADGGDDDDCFSIELDLNTPHSQGDSPSVNWALELISSGSPESHLEGIQIVQQNLHCPEWLTSFMRSDGIGQCVELMGCFSPSSVQRAAAAVCIQIATTSQTACEMLLAADVGSMIEQHIKNSQTTLRMFEDASHIVAGIASHPNLAADAFKDLGLMGHFVGILTDPAPDAAPARLAALTAIRSLCAVSTQAHADFFYYGGAFTVVQMLLQSERGRDETMAAVELLQALAVSSKDLREIMSPNGVMGIEVLVQVHRDAEARGDAALAAAAAHTLAILTHRHPVNMKSLESCVSLLGDQGLPNQVYALHSELFVETPPRSPTIGGGLPIKVSSLQLSRSLGVSTVSTVLSDSAADMPTSPPAVRKMSLDGGSSRTLQRMSSSVKSVFGSVRKLMRSDRRMSEDAALPVVGQNGRSSPKMHVDGDGDRNSQRLCVV